MIDDKTLKHLFELSRMKEETDPAAREKLKADFSKILDHFSELQEVDTSHVEPLAGGNFDFNVTRDDGVDVRGEKRVSERDAIVEQFPHHERGYLKVPPVFE